MENKYVMSNNGRHLKAPLAGMHRSSNCACNGY